MTLAWPWLTPTWPSDSSNALRFGWGFFLLNLVAIEGIAKQVDPYMTSDSSNALHFGRGVLPTKFGGHRAYLSILTPGWPWLTPSWPLTPAMPQKI